MLPFLFTALKVGATLAFIGAIVGEYFGGTSDVLGRVVLTAMSSGSYDLAWAGILVGAVGAIVAYLVISLIERVAIPWHSSLRDGVATAANVRFPCDSTSRRSGHPLSCLETCDGPRAVGRRADRQVEEERSLPSTAAGSGGDVMRNVAACSRRQSPRVAASDRRGVQARRATRRDDTAPTGRDDGQPAAAVGRRRRSSPATSRPISRATTRRRA